MNAKATWLGTTAALVVLVVGAAGLETAAQSRISINFLIANVRVFDGERVHERSQVAIEGGIIRAVGGERTAWRHLPVIDGTGATLLPGLIDAHLHVGNLEGLRQTNVNQLRQMLRFGVTTALDMGAASVPESQVFDVRSVARVATDMADLRSAGFLASARRPADSSRPIVSTVEEATQFVAMRHSEGADYLKLQFNGVRSASQGERNLDLAIAKALVDEAHARGMLAIAHIETLDDVAVALSAGVDGLGHVWRRGGANSAEIARRIAERGVFVSATLSIPDGQLDGRASLLADPRFQSALSGALKDQLGRSLVSRVTGVAPNTDEVRTAFAVQLAAVRSLHEAGARLLIGTDAAANTQPAAHGISVHRELELFVRAGLSPTEALTAATANAASAFRLVDRGRIATGRKADLVLVRGDPTTDITATRDILRVWRDGVEFDRALGH